MSSCVDKAHYSNTSAFYKLEHLRKVLFWVDSEKFAKVFWERKVRSWIHKEIFMTEIDPFLQLPLDHSMPFQHSLPRQSRQRNRLIHRRPKNTELSHQGSDNSVAVFIFLERVFLLNVSSFELTCYWPCWRRCVRRRCGIAICRPCIRSPCQRNCRFRRFVTRRFGRSGCAARRRVFQILGEQRLALHLQKMHNHLEKTFNIQREKLWFRESWNSKAPFRCQNFMTRAKLFELNYFRKVFSVLTAYRNAWQTGNRSRCLRKRTPTRAEAIGRIAHCSFLARLSHTCFQCCHTKKEISKRMLSRPFFDFS